MKDGRWRIGKVGWQSDQYELMCSAMAVVVRLEERKESASR